MSLEVNKNYIGMKREFDTVKKYRANFKIESDKDGFYATDMEQGIITDAETMEELQHNIREAVACAFHLPLEQVTDQVEITYS